MIFNLDNFDISDSLDLEKMPVKTQIKIRSTRTFQQIRARDIDIVDKLCAPCIRSKSHRIKKCNKSMIATTNKLEEIHTSF